MIRNMERRTFHDASFRDWSDLILVLIFSRLPMKSLMRFKCVSKHWKFIITHDRCLIKMHEAHLGNSVTSILVCPALSRLGRITPPCPFPGKVEIRSIMFSPKDLRFDEDEQGSSSHSDVTDVTLFRNHDNVILNAGYTVLPPVSGLVCFVNCDQPDSFLIYNPCTGEKTPWIRASANELFVSDFGQKEVASSHGNLRLEHNYMFAFGYDPINRKHKVLCLYVICVFKKGPPRFGLIHRRKVVCGVFTVCENKWRVIDSHQVPLRTARNKKSFYVNGCLCWIHYQIQPKKSEVVVFDVGSEIFRVISIPGCIPKLYAANNTEKLVDELVEVDGNLAILAQQKDDQLNLWTYVDNNGNAGGNWIKETIQLPYRWDELYNLDFKPITGTEVVVVKFRKISQKQHECLLYYNRKEKEYYRNRHEYLFHAYTSGVRYQITPFFETLLPVQTTEDGEEIN